MKDHYLTVGYLREQLKDLPDNTPVLYERIEDAYFSKSGWLPDLLVPDDFEPDVREMDSQYLRAFTAFQFKQGRKKNLCITAHY